MDATLGSNPSYIWRSLMWSRNLLSKRLCWRVSTRTKIVISRDYWIPGRRLLVCQSSTLNENDTVSTLIQNRAWNGPLVRNLFSPFIAQKILDIPISHSVTEDSRYMYYDPKSRYSVKGGYKLDIGFFEPPNHCSEYHSNSWWKHIWSLSIPPKVLIFWWRALHEIIPTGTNLHIHHVPATGACHFCHHAYDSTCHALFWCPETQPCWKGTMFQPLLKKVMHMGIIDVFIWMKKMLSQRDLDLFAMRTWAIWQQRMRTAHGGNKKSAIMNVNWSDYMLTEYLAARDSLQIRCAKRVPISHDRWSKLLAHQLRLDVNVVFHEHANVYSVGGVLRDHEGQIVLVFGLKTEKPPSVVVGELVAIREGLRLVFSRGLEVHEISSDSLLAVQAVTCSEEDILYVGANCNRCEETYRLSS